MLVEKKYLPVKVLSFAIVLGSSYNSIYKKSLDRKKGSTSTIYHILYYYLFVPFQPVSIDNVVFIETPGCPVLTWNADKHGLCDVDLFLMFVQKDGSMKSETVPVADGIYQHCSLTMNAKSVFYKTIVYLRTKTNGKRIRTSDADSQSFQKSLVTTTTATTTTTNTIPTTITIKPKVNSNSAKSKTLSYSSW